MKPHFALVALWATTALTQSKPRPSPGQCFYTYECRGLDGKVVPPANPVPKECETYTETRDREGKVIYEHCEKSQTTEPPEEKTKPGDGGQVVVERPWERGPRPSCGPKYGGLTCDPDNGWGGCCSEDG